MSPLARAVGISHDSVQRIWKANDLNPDFESKFRDVIGLYPNPPDKALALCCDEKPCPDCRWVPGISVQRRTITTEHGTITLFAALNYPADISGAPKAKRSSPNITRICLTGHSSASWRVDRN
jgi:hypothetical protein